jgi:hypothetical protein
MPANDPAALSPEERALRIAALLAIGVRRLLVRSTKAGQPKKPTEFISESPCILSGNEAQWTGGLTISEPLRGVEYGANFEP